MARKVVRKHKKQFLFPWILMILGVIVFLALSVWFVSQRKAISDQKNKAAGGNQLICRDKSGVEMGMSEALTIAKNSECGQKGTFISLLYCNRNTGTWWIDMNTWTSNLLCSPACVIFVNTKNVEINPRCTGALPRDDAQCKRTGCNKEICQDASVADRVTTCDVKPEDSCYSQHASCKVQGNGHCGFSPMNSFASCMTSVKCGWCGNACGPINTSDCGTEISSNSQLCLWQDNVCKIVNAPCGWCGERCERVPSSKSCSKSSTVPTGLSCDPVGSSGYCTINGLPVVPTNVPGYCDDSCQTQSDCVGWLGCYEVTSGIKRCRKPQCVNEHTCFCPTGTPTPVPPTPIPTAKVINVPGYCDDSCQTQSDCVGWLGCYEVTSGIKRCRKPQCVNEHTCFCPTGTPTPVPPTPIPTAKVIIIRVTATPTVTPIPVATESVAPTPTEKSVEVQLRVLSQGNLVSSGVPAFVMTGLATPLSIVNISIQPDGISSTVEADADGAWKLSIPSALTVGEKRTAIIATDTLGSQDSLQTEFTIGGSVETGKKPALPYVLVFAGVGALAVIVFFVFFLRRI